MTLPPLPTVELLILCLSARMSFLMERALEMGEVQCSGSRASETALGLRENMTYREGGSGVLEGGVKER